MISHSVAFSGSQLLVYVIVLAIIVIIDYSVFYSTSSNKSIIAYFSRYGFIGIVLLSVLVADAVHVASLGKVLKYFGNNPTKAISKTKKSLMEARTLLSHIKGQTDVVKLDQQQLISEITSLLRDKKIKEYISDFYGSSNICFVKGINYENSLIECFHKSSNFKAQQLGFVIDVDNFRIRLAYKHPDQKLFQLMGNSAGIYSQYINEYQIEPANW